MSFPGKYALIAVLNCWIAKKTNEQILRKAGYTRTDGWTHKRTDKDEFTAIYYLLKPSIIQVGKCLFKVNNKEQGQGPWMAVQCRYYRLETIIS